MTAHSLLGVLWRGAWSLLLAYLAAAEALNGSWLWAAGLSAACCAAAWETVKAIRYSRTPEAAARGDLARAVRTLDREALYINRSGHVILTRHRLSRWIRGDCVDRWPESDFQEFAEAGQGVITHECFRLPPSWRHVIRRQESDQAEVAGDSMRVTTPRVRWRQQPSGMIRILRMARTGLLFASEDEIRELTAQIMTAELLTP